jgi:hypothetical protein
MKRCQILLYLATLISLLGCSSVTPSLQPDNNFALSAQLELKKPLLAESDTSSPSAVERLLWYRKNAVACLDNAIVTNPRDSDACTGKLQLFINAAITLSNDSCDAWFDKLITSDVETTYAKNWLNIAGNSAQALMGLTGDSPTQIGKVALALGLSNAGFDNYRSVYLMSSTLFKIRKTIDEGRRVLSDVLRTRVASYTSWDDANEDAKLYHKTCSREAIQEILNKGVEATAYLPPNFDAQAIAFENANQQLFSSIYKASGQFSDEELSLLAGDTLTVTDKSKKPETLGLISRANDAFQALDPRQQSDFRRWLEIIKKHVAETKAAADREKAKATKDADLAKTNAAEAEKALKAHQDKTNAAPEDKKLALAEKTKEFEVRRDTSKKIAEDKSKLVERVGLHIQSSTNKVTKYALPFIGLEAQIRLNPNTR